MRGVTNERGESYETATWSEIDVAQWQLRQPRARAWFSVPVDRLGERVRDRTVAEMIDSAEAAGAPVRRDQEHVTVETVAGVTTTLGGLAIDEHARGGAGVFACGADAGGIAAGGYASGLAAALVFGRIAARAALGSGRERGAGTGGPPPPPLRHRRALLGRLEEELLVDADTLQLAHVADQVLPGTGLPRERIDHEAFLAKLEVRSEPSGSVGEAIGQLAEVAPRRTAAGDAARRRAPPRRPALRRRARPSERYERVEAQMQGLIKRTRNAPCTCTWGAESQAAVAAMNGLRQLLPLLHGLGANSPFWFGADSGMASSRRGDPRLPRTRHPPLLRSWEQYLACLDAVRAGGGPTDHTMVWWDARPQPRLGTVELREVDVQTDLDSAAAIAALARAIMRRAVEEPVSDFAPEQALHWSSFRAARDGLDAEIYFEGAARCARWPGRVVETLDGADPELEGIKRIVREGNGADRQRAAHERGGMPGLLRYLADVTARPPGLSPGKPA